MNREEQIALLQTALSNGNIDGIRQYKEGMEQPQNGAIWESAEDLYRCFNNQGLVQPQGQVLWHRKDLTPVVEPAARFMQRVGWQAGIHLPHNGRDPYFQ